MFFQNYIVCLVAYPRKLFEAVSFQVFFFPLKIHMACRAQGDCPLLVLVQK